MSQTLDLSQFPDLPPEVVNAFAAQKAALDAAQFEARVERAARQHEQAVVAEKEAFITELKALIEKLEGQVQDYRRTKFGPKSEKLGDTGADRRCRRQDRGQRDRPRQAQTTRTPQGTGTAGKPAAHPTGGRA